MKKIGRQAKNGIHVEIISMERKEELVERYSSGILYEIKSEIYGCCIQALDRSHLGQGSLEESSIPHPRAFAPTDGFMCCRTSHWEKTWFLRPAIKDVFFV